MIASTLSLRAWACGRSRQQPATRFVTNTVAAKRGRTAEGSPRFVVDGGVYHLVYWAGPLIGGALAALLQHYFLMEQVPATVVETRGGPRRSEERGNR